MSPNTNLSSLDHVAIRVEDLDFYVRFFERVFNMEVSALEGDPERPSQLWIQGAIQLISDPDHMRTEGRLAHIAIRVTDVQSALYRAKEFGAVVHEKGPNWICLPDGAVFELLEGS